MDRIVPSVSTMPVAGIDVLGRLGRRHTVTDAVDGPIAQSEGHLQVHFDRHRLTVLRAGVEAPLPGGLDRFLIEIGIERLRDPYIGTDRPVGLDQDDQFDGSLDLADLGGVGVLRLYFPNQHR
jgi:hypothetical protein